MKLTKKRKQVLVALKACGVPKTAKELHAMLPEIDLVTIYRALEVLVEAGMVAPLHLTPGETSYEYQQEPHYHAICTDCDRVIHFTIKDSDLKKLLPLKQFTIEGIELTVKGSCKH